MEGLCIGGDQSGSSNDGAMVRRQRKACEWAGRGFVDHGPCLSAVAHRAGHIGQCQPLICGVGREPRTTSSPHACMRSLRDVVLVDHARCGVRATSCTTRPRDGSGNDSATHCFLITYHRQAVRPLLAPPLPYPSRRSERRDAREMSKRDERPGGGLEDHPHPLRRGGRGRTLRGAPWQPVIGGTAEDRESRRTGHWLISVQIAEVAVKWPHFFLEICRPPRDK